MRFKIFLVLYFCISIAFAQEMSKDERKLVNRYTKDLKNKDESVRFEAVESLRYYKYPEVANLLAGALNDPSESIRNRAALSLFELEEAATPAVPALQEALHDSDPYVRINSAATLFNLNVNRPETISAVEELLSSPQPRVQISAVRFLQGNVPFTKLLPVLRSAVKDPDPEIRADASKEFSQVEELPAEALPVLTDLLKDQNATVRENAASALRKFKTKGTAALPALLRSLKDPNRDVRSHAVNAIESMGTWAASALPDLREVVLHDSDAGVRSSAVGSLEWIDPEGKEAMPIVLESLKDRDSQVRVKALETMLSFRPFPVPSVPAVQAALAGETNADVKRLLQRVMERGEQDKEFSASMKRGGAGKTPKQGISKEEANRILQEKGIQLTMDELWHSIHEGDSQTVQAMLAAGISPNSELQGMSVLTVAVSFYDGSPEQKEIIQALIDFGADVNYKTDIDVTPFFYCAGKCEPDLLLAMIQAGAVLEVKAKGGATALTEAAMQNKVENVRLLFKSGYKLKNEPTWLISSTKNPQILEIIRKEKAKQGIKGN
jgi:HEAT repeat protein